MQQVAFDFTINLPTIIAGLTAIFALGKGVGVMNATLSELKSDLKELRDDLEELRAARAPTHNPVMKIEHERHGV